MKKDPIFIVGMHRSGVNFLGNLLSTMDELNVVHDEVLENMIHDVVLHKTKKHNIYIQNIYDEMYYRSKERLVHPCYPNFWRVLVLQKQFPMAKFIILVRDPYSSIQSMLNQAITKDLLYDENWLKYDMNNSFLGLDPYFMKEEVFHNKVYEDFTLAEKCALRWAVHARYASIMIKDNPKAIIPINFDSLLKEKAGNKRFRTMRRLANYAQLEKIPTIDDNLIDETVDDTRENFTNEEKVQLKQIILDYFLIRGNPDQTMFPIRHYFADQYKSTFDLSYTKPPYAFTGS